MLVVGVFEGVIVFVCFLLESFFDFDDNVLESFKFFLVIDIFVIEDLVLCKIRLNFNYVFR